MHKISKFCISEEKTSKFYTSECTSKFCTMWINKTSKFCTCEENTSNLSTNENASKLSTGECIKLANQNGSSVSRLSLALWGIKGQVDVTAGEWWWQTQPWACLPTSCRSSCKIQHKIAVLLFSSDSMQMQKRALTLPGSLHVDVCAQMLIDSSACLELNIPHIFSAT